MTDYIRDTQRLKALELVIQPECHCNACDKERERLRQSAKRAAAQRRLTAGDRGIGLARAIVNSRVDSTIVEFMQQAQAVLDALGEEGK